MATKRTTKKAETMAAKKAAKTVAEVKATAAAEVKACLLYTSPSPRD